MTPQKSFILVTKDGFPRAPFWGEVSLLVDKRSLWKALHALKYFVKSSKKYLGAHSLTHNAKILAFVLSTPPYIHTRVTLFVRTSLLLYCLDPPAGLRIGEAQLTVPVCSFGCFGSDQSASYPPEKMTLTRVEFLLSLAHLSNAIPVMFPSNCGHHWWLGSDGQPTQNLHCGQLFPDQSSTTSSPTAAITSPTTSSSPFVATGKCTEDEFLCGDGSTCLPFSKLCDEVKYCSSCSSNNLDY